MKKHLIAAAVAAAVAAPAMAQVSISGGVQTELANTGAAGAETGMFSGSGGINHLTFTANEDLGGGLKARAVLNKRFFVESGRNINPSTTNAQTFTAQASGGEFQNSFVELSGGFGAILMGRTSNDTMSFLDPWGGSGQQGSIAMSAAGTRVDNLVLYTSPRFNGFTLRAGTSQTATAGSQEFTTYVVNYSNGPVNLRISTEESATDTKITSYGGTYKLSFATVGLGLSKTENAAGVTTVDQLIASFTAPISGKVNLRGGFRDDKTNANSLDKWALGAQYMLSKRTHVYGDAFKLKTNENTGFAVGVVHNF